MGKSILLKSIISKIQLEELYLNQRLSMYEIARLVGFDRRTISRQMKNWGILSRKPQEATPRGKDHYHWKGGRTGRNGYIEIRLFPDNPYFPMVKNSWGYLPEHRYVMAQHLGRCLKSTEIIHHLNGRKNDNRLCNLGLVTRRIHTHHTLQKLLQKRIRDLEAQLAQQKLPL